MSLNRREMLRLGAYGAAGVMLSSAASASTPLPSFVYPPSAGSDPLAPLPAAPQAIATAPAPGGIDARLLARAKAALDQHKIAPRDSIGIVDFSQPSSDPRFHLVDLLSGRVDSHLVAHGRGSDPDHSGFVERFSNEFRSHATSSGTYVTSDYYNGKYGLSMRVRGLDWSNYNAEPDMIPLHGKLGRSEGCFAMSRKSQYEVMRRLAGGRMIYADKLA